MEEAESRLRGLEKEIAALRREYESAARDTEEFMKGLGLTDKSLRKFEDELSPEGKKLFAEKREEFEALSVQEDPAGDNREKTSGLKLRGDWV